MPVQNLNNGLLNGVAGSYGSPTGLNPVYPNIAYLDRRKKAVTFCDFFGNLGDFSASFTPLFNDITLNYSETRTNNLGAGGLWMASASNGTFALGIRKGTTAGTNSGGASMVRPFVFETLYEMLSESNTSNTFFMYFGVDNQLTTHPQQSNFNGSGVWFEYTHTVNGGNWQFRAALWDSTFAFIDVTINTPFSAYNNERPRKLRIEKDVFGEANGVYRGYIDDRLVGEIPVNLNQFIYPVSLCEARAIMRKTTSSGAVNRIKFDYLLYETDLNR